MLKRKNDTKAEKEIKLASMLIITDSQGISLAFSEAIVGNHNDAFELVENVD